MSVDGQELLCLKLKMQINFTPGENDSLKRWLSKSAKILQRTMHFSGDDVYKTNFELNGFPMEILMPHVR